VSSDCNRSTQQGSTRTKVAGAWHYA